MTWLRYLAGLLAGLLLLLLRVTCRYRFVADPRPALRAARRPSIYALLHAHQVSAIFANDDPAMTAMVSRSTDGDLLVPALALRRVTAVRGSSRKGDRDKGGRRALEEQAAYLAAGVPALLAVDGPRGPRGSVRRGVADLACQTGHPILPLVAIPSRRWILRRTWDRLQIPKPFSRITVRFGPLLPPSSCSDPLELAREVERQLGALEREHDPEEAGHAARAAPPPSELSVPADRSTRRESEA